MNLFLFTGHLRDDIRKFERKYKKHYPIFFLLEGLFLTTNVLTPLLIKKTIDSAFYRGDVGEIALFSVLYFIVLVAQSFIMYKLNYSAAKYLLNASRARESKSAYAKILALPLTYANSQNTGDYLSVFMRDVPKVASGVYLGRLQFFFNLGFFLAVLFLLFILSVKLTLVVLVSIVLFFVSTSILRKMVIRASQRDQESYQRFLKRSREVVEGIPVLKQFSGSSFLKNFLDSSAGEWSRASIAHSTANELSNRNIDINRWIGSTIVLAFGIYLLWKGEISVGTLLAFESYMNWMYDIVRMALTGLTMFFSTLPNWENFARIFSMPFERASGINLEKFEKLQLRNVYFKYDGTPVLTGLNFEINSGDKIAIVARSGAGKSTLVSLFNRLLSPTEGEILINGVPIEQYSLQSLRRNIVLVRSNDILFDTTIRNNITLFEDFPEDEIENVLKMCECDFVEKLESGIDTIVGERGTKLSDGQRQRIVLARALIRKPQVLILDEATSGVDGKTEERIFEKILREIETVIIISHRLSTVRKAKKIYVMENGRILDSGSHEELIVRCEKYTEILKEQFVE
ncbi:MULTISPECIES: ABC transporter ATP-binding protein [Thermotogaceae]|uniref:ABC transporter related n=5 Tax=Thermotogaceae TaxID=188709 RepID=A8F6J5_PSELT|nr:MULTISPECIES: ABC transporter ATP-binding protein [Thermotogaceae]ABQ47477.1 ABC transporter related [Thermotoga petrophila RKU-1]ABV33779.1 ABC transporter related [Pseudothermotoga lettingae TMO]ACB09849.1 ABC transporter related [Thermotoga sp. RQ2]ADA67566.1 ABC transporter related protein [Thermotoga petrophila RKU-10]KAF2960278.1 ABC transporter ATP-binding protein [Thermotoga sp. 38H-to]